MKRLSLFCYFFFFKILLTFSQGYNQWTWVNGDSTHNAAPVYGTKGTTALTNYPGVRYEAAEWKDLNGKFWIYGGYQNVTPNDFSDLWKYDPIINQWTWMQGSNVTGVQPVWGTMGVPSAANTPGARHLGPASWTDKNGKFWLYGGGQSAGGNFFYNDMWVYDPATNQWTWMAGTNLTNQVGVYGTKGVFAPGNMPGAHMETDCAVTDSHGILWYFGGQGIDSAGTIWNHSNELWKFDPNAVQWAFVGGNKLGDQKGVYGTLGVAAPTNWPGARQIHLGWIDSKDNIWFWGGKGLDASNTNKNYLNDMWMYNTTTGMWTWMSGSNVSTATPTGNYGTQCVPAPSNMPFQRIEHRSRWTDDCDNLWFIGGSYYDGVLGQEDGNDLWRYSTKTNMWTWVSGDNTPGQPGVWGTKGVSAPGNKPEAMEGANAYYVKGDGLWLIGGANWHDYGVGLFHSPIIWHHFGVWKYVPDKPNAAFSFAVNSACSAQTAIFTDNSVPNCNEIKSWAWNFGDPASGTSDTSSIQNPVHNFSGPGTYTVKLVVHNCTAGTDSISKPVTVTAGASFTSSAVPTAASCSGTGSATVTLSGGTGPFTYSWTPTGGTTATASGLAPGTYTCTVKDANGCSTVSTATVAAGSGPTVTNAGQVNVLCNGNNTGSASVNATGGTSPYTYSWSPSGGTTATATNLAAGTYTCTVKDASGCQQMQTITITQPAVLSATAGQVNVLCNGNNTGSASVSATGGSSPYTYSWSPSGSNSATANSLSAGTYTCTVKDASGCQQTQTVTITQPGVISATATSTPASCGSSNGTASASVSGGVGPYTYSWTPAGGNAATTSGIPAGNYTCAVTDANGCSMAVTVSVNSTGGPALAIASQTNLLCSGGNSGVATISATGGTAPFTFSWSPSGGNAATANGLAAGTYTCTVKDASGCQQTQTVTITQPVVITASATSTAASCGTSNGTATASVSGGVGPYTYSWTPAGGNAATTSGIPAGNYNCAVTDANGCTMSVTASVNNSGGPTLAISSQSNLLCNGGNSGVATISATGGTAPFTFSWSPSGGNSATANSLAAGTYTCTVTDAGGCVQIQMVTITQPSVLNLTTSSISSCSGHNGSATALASGGTGVFTYSWSPAGGTGLQATGLIPGTYTCFATDANGCTKASTVTVLADTLPVVTVSPDVTISLGSSTTLQGSGTGNYLWMPDTGLSCSSCANPIAAPISTTTYCLAITGFTGCRDSACVKVTVDLTCGQAFVPNFFSPNGDGVNDLLCVYGSCIQELSFSIYDRWGEKVFETTDPGFCWDGTFHGQNVNTAVFAYYLQATLRNGQTVTGKGNISLVR